MTVSIKVTGKVRLLATLSAFLITILLIPVTGFSTEHKNSDTSSPVLKLAPDETAWIKQHPEIRIQMSRGYPPFEFMESGISQGLAYDYLIEAARRVGLRVVVTNLSWSDALKSIGSSKNEVDLLLAVTSSDERRKVMDLTAPYLVFPQVVINRKDGEFVARIQDLDGRSITVEKDYVITGQLKKDLPDAKIEEVVDSLTALRKVSEGKVDAYVGNLAVASYHIDKSGFTNLKIAAPTNYGDDAMAMGVRSDWPELTALLNKSLASFSPEDHHKIRHKWFELRFEHGIRPRDVFKWILAVAGIALVFIVQLRRMVRKRTEELKREIDLRKEIEEQLRLYIHRLPIACILWGTDYRVQSWNPSAERIFGYSVAEALGKTANELIVPLSARERVNGVWKRISEGEPEAGSTNENVTKDGTIILCEWTNTPYCDKDGNVTGVISVALDITERKKSSELMIQSEKMTMVAGMAAGMAHEVNNPLGIISQDLQNLERRFSPALPANCKIADELGLDLYLVEQYMERRDMLNYISSMRSAVKRASGIISNVLQFSRQSDSAHQLLNINEVIEQSIKLTSSDYDLRKKYDFKNVLIAREFDEHLPLVSVSSTEMVQVIINLLKNSAQAMFEAGTAKPSILISTLRNNGHVKVVIKDNGPGMSEATRQRAFDPFFTTKDIGAGTGLGLSVSYTIVTKNHGGELTVESKAGQGASFTIKLPVRAE